MMNRHGLNAIVGVIGVLTLAACGEETEVVEQAAGDCPAGVAATDGWLSLPAVAENPGAAYFHLTNGGEEQILIRSVSVLGAESAVMHETSTWNLQPSMDELFALAVAPGETVVFEPGGKHVMAMGIGEGVAAGSETEVTLSITGSGECSFPVTTYPAGELPEGFEPVGNSEDNPEE